MSSNQTTPQPDSWPEAGQFRRSIRLEFSLYVAALILALMMITGYVLKEKYVETVTRDVVDKILVQARSFSGNAGKHIMSADALMLNNVCKKLASDNTDVYWAGISGPDDVLLAHTDIRQVMASARLTPQSGPGFGEILRPEETFASRGDTIFITIPIKENDLLLGRLGVASSRRQIHEARAATLTTVASVTALMILIGLPIMTLALSRKLRPISVITNSLKNISVDDLTIDIPLSSKNEFGYLAETLRVMGSRLNTAQQERLENERITRELEIAREIQASILPRSYPHTELVEFAGTYQSAREVGGDYYDFIEFDENRLAFLVADVSGKSLPGMLVMLLTRDMVRQYTRTIQPPATILSEVNRDLSGSIKKGMFVTMFLGLLDQRTGQFDFASAGHNPLIRVDGETGATEELKTKGYPLGMLPAGPFDKRIESGSLILSKNDWLVQYTDGINEAQNESAEEYGMERFLEELHNHHAQSPENLISGVLRQHRQFVGEAPQYDDITLLAMKWNGLTVDNNSNVHSEVIHAG